MSKARELAGFSNGLSVDYFPSGSIVQVVPHHVNPAAIAITTTGEIAIPGWSFTLNKKFSDSTVIMQGRFYGYYNSAPSYWSIKARINGANTITTRSVGTDPALYDAAIFSHNSTQYAFGSAAHQEYSLIFYDQTDTLTASYTYFYQQNSAGSFNTWSATIPQIFIYTEVKN